MDIPNEGNVDFYWLKGQQLIEDRHKLKYN